MTIANRVRRIYERHPYPDPRLRLKPTWYPPAIEWIDAVREAEKPFDPRRILIGGCGVGVEAFAFAGQFPRASVVAVDFSERSIATANKMKRKSPVGDRVTFAVADLASANLAKITGGDFDLVTCHGVLSYIPDTAAVLRNFERVLSRDGVLLLDVNGASHPSVRYRHLLPQFGIDVGEFRESARMRDVLRVFESLIVFPPIKLAHREAGFLAGDIFGPLNLALTLSEWATFIRSARLQLLGAVQTFFLSRELINNGLSGAVMPRSRAELAELIDDMERASFHRLVVSKKKPQRIDWKKPESILDLRPRLTQLYKITWPRKGSRGALRTVVLKSKPVNTKVELEVPPWEVEILRAADGSRSIREILRKSYRVKAAEVAEAIYLLYQLCALNLKRS